MGNAEVIENSTVFLSIFIWPTFGDPSDKVQMYILVRGF